jgi:hypothetical protein
MHEYEPYITIGEYHEESGLRVFCTFNNVDDELSQGAFMDMVRSTVMRYRDAGFDAFAYARNDCVDYTYLEDFENPLFINDVVPILMRPQKLAREVAYELGQMDVKLSGFTEVELDKATALSQRQCLISWGIEDVYQQAEEDDIELTEEQAHWVLYRIKNDHDAGIGVNWDVLSSLIGQVAPQVS